ERRIVAVLRSLGSELAGTYHSLHELDETEQQRLISSHLLFRGNDRFLASAGIERDWPDGRGLFHTADQRLHVWVNEEDHLRIVSMQPGGDFRQVFDRLARALTVLEARLRFVRHSRYGYLSSCPTNLGTAMRASVHIRLPRLTRTPDVLLAACDALGLSM